MVRESLQGPTARRSPSGRRRAVTGIVGVAIAVGIAGCGGSSSSDEPVAASSGSPSPGLAEAKTVATEATVRPTTVPITEPVKGTIPTGKKVYFISCGFDVCNQMGQSLTEAAKILGWTVTVLNTDATPAKVSAAWAQAARAGDADAVYGSGTPLSVIQPSLNALKKQGAFTGSCCTLDPENDALTLAQGGDTTWAEAGRLQAAQLLAGSDGSVTPAVLTIPGYSTQPPTVTGFKDAMKEWAPDTEVATIDIPPSAVGKDNSNLVVSFLRANPKVDAIAATQGALTVGLPAALKAAGLTDITITETGGSSNTTFQYLTQGQLSSAVYPGLPDMMYLAADAMARFFVDEPISEAHSEIPLWTITKDTMPSQTPDFPVVEDIGAKFSALWGK